MIQTEALQIVIGIPKSIGDTLSAEQGIQVYPLILKNPTTGLTLDSENHWQPGRPALKNGGQWNDGALVDGRTLVNDVVGNVTETIQLIATAQNMRGLATLLATLQRFVNRARQFSATGWQIEPVYLEWAALDGYGSQYALIYDIQMDVRYDQPSEPQGARVTLVIEREPAWRGIPPGVSPRVWTKYAQGQIPGKDWNYTDLAFSDSNALFEVTVQNRTEFTESTDDYDYPSVSKNWAELDGSKIPGDAPALACVTVDTTQYSSTDVRNSDLYVALSSKPHELPERGTSARNRQRVYQLNFNDAVQHNGDTFTATTDNTDGVKGAAAATIQTMNDVAAITTFFFFPSYTAGRKLSYAMQRGKFLLFLRAKYVSGSTGSTEITPTVYTNQNIINFPTTIFTFPSAPAGAYLGTFLIPLQGNTIMSPDGIGQEINSNVELASDTEFGIDINIRNNAGVSAFIDLTMMPVDESIARLHTGNSNNSPEGNASDIDYIAIDSTGYLSRCQGTSYVLIGSNVPAGNELTGTDLVLQPGMDNYIILFYNDPTFGVSGVARDNYSVKVDIVPRWYGVRDR